MSKWVTQFRTKVKKLLPASKTRILADTYEFKEDLGVGNFSVVKRAVNRKTGEIVAIKIYDKARLSSYDRDCIKTEVEIMKFLRHPNVIGLKESYDTHKKLYIVMEFMGGGELLEYIQKRKVFPEADASKIFMQIISALLYLHANGIVHRDLKPDNLLLTSEGDDFVVKLADFGFAKRIGEGCTLSTPCGSPIYTAPEIAREESYDKSVDMWSAGVILYIMLCGFPPFYHRDPAKLFDEIAKGVFHFPDPYWKNISPAAKELVSLLLKFEGSDRVTAQQTLSHSWLANPPGSSTSTLPSPERLEKNLNTKEFQKAVESSVSSGEPFQLGDAVASQIWQRRMSKRIAESTYTNSNSTQTYPSTTQMGCKQLSCCSLRCSDTSVGGDSCDKESGSYSCSFEVRVDELSVKSDSSVEEFI